MVLLVEFVFLGFDLGALILQQLVLGLQGKGLTHDLQILVVEALLRFIEVTAHLLVLDLQEVDMLVRSLIIVVQTADTALFLVFDDLLFQNSEFEVHEVNLLLQIKNVLITPLIDIWIVSHHRLMFLVLSVELHLDCGFIAIVAITIFVSFLHALLN